MAHASSLGRAALSMDYALNSQLPADKTPSLQPAPTVVLLVPTDMAMARLGHLGKMLRRGRRLHEANKARCVVC